MKLHSSKIDLSDEVRQGSINLLNASLSDAIDLAYHAKQAHWNVRGISFKELHELFDELHEEIEEYIDLVAERIVALGGTALGTVQQVAQSSRLSSYPTDIYAQEAHLEALSSTVAEFARYIRQAIQQAADLGDAGTSDLFTEISRGVDKKLWMLEAPISSK